MKKAHDKAVTDYAFHCIITDLGSRSSKKWASLIREASPASSSSWPTRRLHAR